MATNAQVRCNGPVNRRIFLQTGATAVGGLSLTDIFRLRAQAEERSQAKDDTAVLFVWLPGGPAHVDTYDMKT